MNQFRDTVFHITRKSPLWTPGTSTISDRPSARCIPYAHAGFHSRPPIGTGNAKYWAVTMPTQEEAIGFEYGGMPYLCASSGAR